MLKELIITQNEKYTITDILIGLAYYEVKHLNCNLMKR